MYFAAIPQNGPRLFDALRGSWLQPRQKTATSAPFLSRCISREFLISVSQVEDVNPPRHSFCLSFRICSKIDSAQAGGSGPLLKSNFIPSANFHRSIHKIPVPT
jgi:hypothetical protein